MNFDLLPTTPTTTYVLGTMALLLVVLATASVWITWSASHSSLSISNRAIHLHVPFYGRAIPTSSVDLSHAKISTFDASPELRTTLRINGIGLPGYNVGWFKLANGTKALVAVTSSERVLYIPTHEGFALLVTVREPDAVLQALRSPVGA